MAKTNKTGEPWLMASALLGLSQLRRMMRQQGLTLGQVEGVLRKTTEDIKRLCHLPGGPIAWATCDLGSPPRHRNRLYYYKTPRGARRISESDAVLASISNTEVIRSKKHNDFRVLESWLVDQGSEAGGKLLIANSYEQSFHGEKARVRKQLEKDSNLILKVLKMLEGDTMRIRRRSAGKDVALQLSKLSLKQADIQDTEKTLREEELRLELIRAKEQVRWIRFKIKELIGKGRKSGTKQGG